MDQLASPFGIGRDPEAFEVFYRAHVEAVQRFVARRVGDPEVAADLTADVFVALIEAADGYRPELGSPVAWLYGIAHRVVSGHRRRRLRELELVRRVSGRRLLDADGLERVQERLDAQRAARRLQPALDRLPAGERATFELVALDGLSLTDAAAALGVKPVTARVRLHRARRALGAAANSSARDRPRPGEPTPIPEVLS
jgi:RNA polymerase sigma-70 factor (ECF subfamily)